MAIQHYRWLNGMDIDSVLDYVGVKKGSYAGELKSCRKILALYRKMEEVGKWQEKEKITYATAKKQIITGIYKDKREKRYKVRGVVKLSGSEVPVVIYEKLGNDEEELLACTPEYFLENSLNGRNGMKRFTKIVEEVH